MTEPTETVDLVGVRANGEHVNLGKVAKPPRMKAREIAQSYFGPFQDDDGSESDACFGALEELIDWLVKQGWTPPQPTQAQAGAVPLTDGQAKEVLWTEHLRWMQAAGLDTEGMRPTGEWLDHWLTYVRAIERAHGIGIKGGQHG